MKAQGDSDPQRISGDLQRVYMVMVRHYLPVITFLNFSPIFPISQDS